MLHGQFPALRGVHKGVHKLKKGCSERLVGAPRFELGTPCTPCIHIVCKDEIT